MDKKQNILCCIFFFLFLPGEKKVLIKEKTIKQPNKQFQDSLFKFIHNISHNTLPKEPKQ